MSISKPDYQLMLPLEIDETISDQRSALSPEEIKLRSETARSAFDGQSFPWMEEYKKLREGGWDWRVAAYIAWASSPKGSRVPKSQDELARGHLGLMSDRAISTWRRKNPAIDEMVAVLQSAPLWEHRSEIYEALIAVATTHEYKGHNDRKLALELLGDYIPRSKLEAELNQRIANDLINLPFDEKLRLAGFDNPEKLEELKKKIADEMKEEDEEESTN